MGVGSVEGDLVLGRESESSPFRQDMGPKLVHEKWTGPWKVVKVVLKVLNAVIEMEGRKTRTGAVSMTSLKPFYTEQIAWGSGFGLKGDTVAAVTVYMLMGRRTIVSASGVARWQYRGKRLDGVSSDQVAQSEALHSFTPLQLDAFHAIWSLNPPISKQTSTASLVVQRKRAPFE